MLNVRKISTAILGIAGLFLGANLASAQTYFYGWYYPDEQKLVTYQHPNTYVQDNFTPQQFGAMTHQPVIGSAAYQQARIQPAAVAPSVADIKVTVPNAQAHVWFDGHDTTTLGSDRLYRTPTLVPGRRYSYHLRATWMQNGTELTSEQTISVEAGQTTFVNFTEQNAVASAMARDRK